MLRELIEMMQNATGTPATRNVDEIISHLQSHPAGRGMLNILNQVACSDAVKDDAENEESSQETEKLQPPPPRTAKKIKAQKAKKPKTQNGGKKSNLSSATASASEDEGSLPAVNPAAHADPMKALPKQEASELRCNSSSSAASSRSQLAESNPEQSDAAIIGERKFSNISFQNLINSQLKPGEGGPADDLFEEDLTDINAMVEKLKPLSKQSCSELSNYWAIKVAWDPESEEHSQLWCRTNIVERIRYLAVLHMISVADKYNCMPQGQDKATMTEIVTHAIFSLRYGISYADTQTRAFLAVLFDLEADATYQEICTTVSGLGITSFFQPIPVPTLEQVCRDFQIDSIESTSSTAVQKGSKQPKKTPAWIMATDPDTRHEYLTHRICCYLYPGLSSRNDMKLNCVVRLKVHENAPSKYTCTIDNACMMAIATRQLHISNPFFCNKMKFRAQLVVDDHKLSFGVIHRQPVPLNLQFVVRTSAEGKSKKGKNARSAFSRDCSGIASSGQSFNIKDMLKLEEVFRSPRSSQTGMRLYGDDDRVLFQFTLEATAPEGATPNVEVVKTTVEEKEPKAPPESNTTKNTQGVTISELIAAEEEDKRMKAQMKRREQMLKRVAQVETAETQAREKVVQSSQQEWSRIKDEGGKSLNRSSQKQKERQRKAEFAKVQPNEELQGQLSSLQGTVGSARSVVKKLVEEKRDIDTEKSKLQDQVDSKKQQSKALEEERVLHEEELTLLLGRIESLTLKLEKRRRNNEKKEQAKQAAATLSLENHAQTATTSTAASIKDLQSFWGIGTEEVITNNFFDGKKHPQQSPPISSASQPTTSFKVESFETQKSRPPVVHSAPFNQQGPPGFPPSFVPMGGMQPPPPPPDNNFRGYHAGIPVVQGYGGKPPRPTYISNNMPPPPPPNMVNFPPMNPGAPPWKPG